MRKSKTNLEIDKMLTLSTAHITKETADLLEREVKYLLDKIPLAIYNKAEFGWFIHVPDEYYLEKELVPNDLLECVNIAIKYNCKWLCLDCDGLIIPELKIYDWD